MGILCVIAPYYIYNVPESASYEEIVKRAIAGVILSIIGGFLIVLYIWKK